MENSTKLGFAPEEDETPKRSRFEKWMDNGYAPCTKLLIASVVEKDDGMSKGGRVLLGTMGAIGAPIIDPVIWFMKKFDIDPGNPDADPNDAGGYL